MDSAIERPVLPDVHSAVRVLLVEDDPGDAVLAREYLSDAVPEVSWVQTVTDACALLARERFDCVVLDLNLPDTIGFTGLERVQQCAPDVAIVVLTGDGDGARGIGAVAAGAQDYLVKGQVDAPLLARAVLYAAERKRTESSLRELRWAHVRQEENARLQRGLLPVPLLDDAPVSVVTRYRPGREQAQLGGDFFDVVQTGDGRTWIVIGDVSGHGPDEAALGVCLRVGWRTLVLAGLDPAGVLPAVQRLLVHERHHEEIFASVLMVILEPDAAGGQIFVAGHPAPIVLRDGKVELLPVSSGTALGIVEYISWSGQEVELGDAWSLLCFTDGLIEGYADPPARLGDDGLIELIAKHHTATDPSCLVDAVIEDVVERNGGPLVDDVAVVHLRRAE